MFFFLPLFATRSSDDEHQFHVISRMCAPGRRRKNIELLRWRALIAPSGTWKKVLITSAGAGTEDTRLQNLPLHTPSSPSVFSPLQAAAIHHASALRDSQPFRSQLLLHYVFWAKWSYASNRLSLSAGKEAPPFAATSCCLFFFFFIISKIKKNWIFKCSSHSHTCVDRHFSSLSLI